MLEVIAEAPEDHAAVHQVNEMAFGRPNEAALVNALREAGALLVSLVAVESGSISGHVHFSHVSVEPEPSGEFSAFGLTPLAVLGDPAYYRRSGFAPARQGGYAASSLRPTGHLRRGN